MQVNDLHLYLKCHSSTGVFKHFAIKNQLPGLTIIGKLVENGLNQKKLKDFERTMNSNFHLVVIRAVLLGLITIFDKEPLWSHHVEMFRLLFQSFLEK